MSEERFGAGAREGGIVDGDVVFDAGDAGAQVRAERRKERGVGRGIVKRLAGGADNTDGAARNEHGDWRRVTIDFFRDDPAELDAFGGRGAHQRHLRVVLVKRTAGEFRGHAGAFAEVHHIEATRRDDGGDTSASGGVEAFGASAEDTASAATQLNAQSEDLSTLALRLNQLVGGGGNAESTPARPA